MSDTPSVASLPTGFGGSYDDYLGKPLDLNTLLVKTPAATVFMRVEGDGMLSAGIAPGDILVIDRSLSPAPEQRVVIIGDGEFAVKQLVRLSGELRLISDTADEGVSAEGCEIVGVVTAAVRQFGVPA